MFTIVNYNVVYVYKNKQNTMIKDNTNIKVSFYIGADNKTGEVEMDTLTTALDLHFKGYTIIPSIGMWEGTQEKSVIVESFVDGTQDIDSICDILKIKMSQNCIIYTLEELNVTFG